MVKLGELTCISISENIMPGVFFCQLGWCSVFDVKARNTLVVEFCAVDVPGVGSCGLC